MFEVFKRVGTPPVDAQDAPIVVLKFERPFINQLIRLTPKKNGR